MGKSSARLLRQSSILLRKSSESSSLRKCSANPVLQASWPRLSRASWDQRGQRAEMVGMLHGVRPRGSPRNPGSPCQPAARAVAPAPAFWQPDWRGAGPSAPPLPFPGPAPDAPLPSLLTRLLWSVGYAAHGQAGQPLAGKRPPGVQDLGDHLLGLSRSEGEVWIRMLSQVSARRLSLITSGGTSYADRRPRPGQRGARAAGG